MSEAQIESLGLGVATIGGAYIEGISEVQGVVAKLPIKPLYTNLLLAAAGIFAGWKLDKKYGDYLMVFSLGYGLNAVL